MKREREREEGERDELGSGGRDEELLSERRDLAPSLEQSFTKAILQTAISGDLPADYKTKPQSVSSPPTSLPHPQLHPQLISSGQLSAEQRMNGGWKKGGGQSKFPVPLSAEFWEVRAL